VKCSFGSSRFSTALGERKKKKKSTPTALPEKIVIAASHQILNFTQKFYQWGILSSRTDTAMPVRKRRLFHTDIPG